MAKLGKALMSLLLDKKARDALEAKAAAAPPARPPQPQAPQDTPHQAVSPQVQPHPAPPQAQQPTQEEINARLNEAQLAASGRVKTPDRRQLIQDALKVRADKAKMLDELPEEQRRRLQALAMMSFMKSRPKS